MLYFNACPKCVTGTIYKFEGIDGPEKKCVNCAFTTYGDELTTSKNSGLSSTEFTPIAS